MILGCILYDDFDQCVECGQMQVEMRAVTSDEIKRGLLRSRKRGINEKFITS